MILGDLLVVLNNFSDKEINEVSIREILIKIFDYKYRIICEWKNYYSLVRYYPDLSKDGKIKYVKSHKELGYVKLHVIHNHVLDEGLETYNGNEFEFVESLK